MPREQEFENFSQSEYLRIQGISGLLDYSKGLSYSPDS